jgi:pilus assembly protein CpaD
MKKDLSMRSKLSIVALASLLGACNAPDNLQAGLTSTHVPVVNHATYVFDAAAPSGMLPSSEMDRLDAWFASLNMNYGDEVYVDGDVGAARSQVGTVAGQYGLLVSDGAPVTPGVVAPGSVRVIVARKEAFVPGCPQWDKPSNPNFNNDMMTNFGCGVNSALAAQVANPQDLIHGRAGAAAGDGATAAKAINMYRYWPLTGIIEGQIKRPLNKADSQTGDDK